MADEDDNTGFVKVTNKSKSRGENHEENGFDEEPEFSDPEDFEEDVTDEELLGDLLAEKPKETGGNEAVIVVDCIPVVGQDRLEKLKGVLSKIFGRHGHIQNTWYPSDDDGKTKGYMFVEYQSSKDAHEAVKGLNGYVLDKQHKLIVNLFSDLAKFSHIIDEPVSSEPQKYVDHGNLHSWLLNAQCCDQFSVIYEGGDKTAVYLNTPGELTVLQNRPRWTETYVRWSPQGTYLATFHQKGVALWGGEKFEQIMKFAHIGLQLIDFSPCERYLVTFSPLPENNKEDPQAIIIWDIRTGQKKRGFHCENASFWPIFKWCSTGEYFARMTTDTLSIYETTSFGLLDKKSMKVKGIRDFAWSPTDNVISYWTPEEQNQPARVVVVEVPSRTQLCVKNLVNVADCKMHWQKSGDHLCVKVDRYKSRKEEQGKVKYLGIFHNFNIFRMREKQIPVDTIEEKESIVAFSWEPVGTKFALIHGDSPNVSVSFYNVCKGSGGRVELLKKLPKRQANHLFWSPAGQFIVLAGLRSLNGVLEFVDTNDMTSMALAEHFMATDVEWDATGRYVCTAVSYWGHKVDNAFWLWNFQGRLVHKQPLDRFCQLLWRPRPSSLLSADSIKEIRKNMKKYSAKFAHEDRMRESKASKEQIDKRQQQMSEFRKWREQLAKQFNEEKEERLSLRKDVDTDELETQGENEDEETVEFLLKVEEFNEAEE